jgi:hypothetical protein
MRRRARARPELDSALATAEDVDDQTRPVSAARATRCAAHRRVLHETAPTGPEQRGEVLDEQRDPDREPVDREEEELDEREPAHAERDEIRAVAPP